VLGAEEVSAGGVGDVVVVPVFDAFDDVVVSGVELTPDDSGFETVEEPVPDCAPEFVDEGVVVVVLLDEVSV
jgi:hypothetical protein